MTDDTQELITPKILDQLLGTSPIAQDNGGGAIEENPNHNLVVPKEVWDKNRDGELDLGEVRKILENYGHLLTPDSGHKLPEGDYLAPGVEPLTEEELRDLERMYDQARDPDCTVDYSLDVYDYTTQPQCMDASIKGKGGHSIG